MKQTLFEITQTSENNLNGFKHSGELYTKVSQSGANLQEIKESLKMQYPGVHTQNDNPDVYLDLTITQKTNTINVTVSPKDV